jgi:hypothetical protein
MSGMKRPHDAIEAEFKEALRTKLEPRKIVRPKRTTRPPFLDSVKNLVYIVAPDYEEADDPRAGGKSSSVTLGPSGYISRNSDSVAHLPRAIVKARERHGIAFVAGHLLNAEFGGDGTDPLNLTILTPAANGAHKAFDTPVKNAVGALRHVYEAIFAMGIDVRSLTYGIAITVATTGDPWGDDFPDSCITSELTCSAQLVNVPDVAQLLADRYPNEADREETWARQLHDVAGAIDRLEVAVGDVDGLTVTNSPD